MERNKRNAKIFGVVLVALLVVFAVMRRVADTAPQPLADNIAGVSVLMVLAILIMDFFFSTPFFRIATQNIQSEKVRRVAELFGGILVCIISVVIIIIIW